jgi:hypothetical protein
MHNLSKLGGKMNHLSIGKAVFLTAIQATVGASLFGVTAKYLTKQVCHLYNKCHPQGWSAIKQEKIKGNSELAGRVAAVIGGIGVIWARVSEYKYGSSDALATHAYREVKTREKIINIIYWFPQLEKRVS